jgi:cardiolipin synthase
MPAWVNLPNLLTLVRLCMVPLVIYFIQAGRYTLGGWLFGAAAFTDILDGAAARVLGLRTETGAYLDPIADKCLLSGVYLALAMAHLAPWWLVAIIFGRDICILAGAAIIMRLTPIRRFPPSVWGKVSTFVQVATAVVWMARSIFGGRVLELLSLAILWPCAAFTVWSGIDYTRKGISAYRKY